MRTRHKIASAVLITAVAALACAPPAGARNPYRRAFFDTYVVAQGSALDNLPSKPGHCGVCHFDFNGSGTRNPYGLGIEVGLNNGLTVTNAILAIQNSDSDADGFANLVEITDVDDFDNTPTFPGLSQANKNNTINVPLDEIEPYLTPSAGIDTTPPTVTLSTPNGGETVPAHGYTPILYTASDASGIAYVNLYLSDDGGAAFMPVALHTTPGSGYSWFVPNRPGSASRIRVQAVDNAGNAGFDDSNANFTIAGLPPGFVPTTMRDIDLPGTQPHEGAILDDPDATCATCHGNYDPDAEPWYNWRGSMMAQAARDPFFFACMAVAEQDAPSVGDVCIRCHTPGGWQEGRSVDTSGGLLTAKDRHGVQCDFCHREVDHNYVPGVSPAADEAVLAAIDPLPLRYANGQFINDPAPLRRGPYADAQAPHAFVESPLHRSGNMCGVCHDVSNPVFVEIGPQDYAPTPFDAAHPDFNPRSMFPIERTYSEWERSEYAATGVYAPQFAGVKPDGMVSTCQDCHMHDVIGRGEVAGPRRDDLGLHDLMGGNHFVPDIIATFFPDEVSTVQLQAAKGRAIGMLQKAATLEATPEPFGLTVRVINETGHKLPSGYPEGRRIWLNVQAFDAGGTKVFESGAYDLATATLSHDAQAKIYEVHPGLSPALAGALGLPAGESFHFVLNDTIYADNRIPPRGFTNAAFGEAQSPPVAHTYADGQYWDETPYHLPTTATTAVVTLNYQSTSREYIEFLRDENRTNSAGQSLYDAWTAQGKAGPIAMATTQVNVQVTEQDMVDEGGAPLPPEFRLEENRPNPFEGGTVFAYALPARAHVAFTVHDASGRRVKTLVDRVEKAGRYHLAWDGCDDRGTRLPAGVYFARCRADENESQRRIVLLR